MSTTTSSTADDGLFRRVVEAVSQMGIPVLASSGTATKMPTVGDNVRLETFIDHEAIFPHVQAVITHGGAGTVGRAFRLGVPMLIIPDFGDQLSTGKRAAELGLAYHLPKQKATPEAIQAALENLLQDQPLLDRVKRLSEEIQRVDGESIAVDAIEQLLDTVQSDFNSASSSVSSRPISMALS